MDILARKKFREKKKEKELRKKLEEEEILKKPEKVYAPSSKTMTIATFFALVFVVAYFFFTSEVIIRNECALMPGLDCEVLEITQNSISLEVSNFLKEDLNITLNIEQCEGEVNNYIRPNKKALFWFNCTWTEEVIKKKISMTYVGYSGLPHDKVGHVRGKTEQE